MRRPPLLENQNRPRLRRLRLEISGSFLPNYLFCAIGLRPRKTSGYTDAEGREEVGVARLTPTVLQTAITRRTGSSPDTETLRGGPLTATEHASVVFGDIDPVRLVWKEPISFAR